jgi:hypothetical protein
MLPYLILVVAIISCDPSPACCGWRLSGERSGGRVPIEGEIGRHPPLYVFINAARSQGPKTSEMWLGVEEDVRQTGRLQRGTVSRFVGWRRQIAYDADEAYGSFRRRCLTLPGTRIQAGGPEVEKDGVNIGEAARRRCLSDTRSTARDRGPRRPGPRSAAALVPKAPTRLDGETSVWTSCKSTGMERQVAAMQGRA